MLSPETIRAFRDELLKIGAMGTTPILPKPGAVSTLMGAHAFPAPSKVPSMSNINPWEVKHISPGANANTMTAATVPPRGRA